MSIPREWFVLIPCLFVVIPTVAHAQPPPATWNEQVTLQTSDGFSMSFAGLNPTVPESFADSLSRAGSSVGGSLAFGPAGPPSLTAHAEGHHYTGAPSWSTTRSTTRGVVSFRVVVRQMATPPVPVSTVPVVMSYNVYSGVRGSFVPCASSPCILDAAVFAQAALLINSEENGQYVNQTIIAQNYAVDIDGVPTSETHYVTPDEILQGSMEAFASTGVEHTNPGAWGEANASIDVGFAIDSVIVPGTMSKYSDFFQLEYSPGYWALGNPTPVARATWGKIKSLYTHD